MLPPALRIVSNRLLQVLDLYWRSLEFCDLWYTSRPLKKDDLIPLPGLVVDMTLGSDPSPKPNRKTPKTEGQGEMVGGAGETPLEDCRVASLKRTPPPPKILP